PRPQRAHPGVQGRHVRRPPRPPPHGHLGAPVHRGLRQPRRDHRRDEQHTARRGGREGRGAVTTTNRNSLFGPLDPAPDAGWEEAPKRKGFLTDTSVCIGCKACEVACKEWNAIPAEFSDGITGNSYDNSE